jgi:hypothetical protein
MRILLVFFEWYELPILSILPMLPILSSDYIHDPEMSTDLVPGFLE